MKNITINYTLQKDEEKSSYVYLLPPTFNNIQELKIKDILEFFPLKNTGMKYHYRFKTITSRDPKIVAWLDISNLNARVPLYENQVHMKVLQLANERGSKIFRDGSDYSSVMSKISSDNADPRSNVNSNGAKTQQPDNQKAQPQQQQQPQTKKPEPQQQQQQQQQPQQSSTGNNSNKSQGSSNTKFDLMGFGEETKTIDSNSTKKAGGADLGSLGSDFMDSSKKTSEYDGLTHDQITALKAQKLKEEMDKKAAEFKANQELDEKTKVERALAYAEFEEKIRKW
eukprot:CAMPEP_0176421268 /NCGR_PEP_ID=MMETSP0127-20121128/9072_1 /TAXON_ID=938130 /ORGANISM="Platyophrya macrostoma, Strain WH" /LENGTH=282 /DNA_ID=CAMNT_0017801965 /DNA_START=19 /DNA_END=864 /DNA_ORIENTATION=-